MNAPRPAWDVYLEDDARMNNKGADMATTYTITVEDESGHSAPVAIPVDNVDDDDLTA